MHAREAAALSSDIIGEEASAVASVAAPSPLFGFVSSVATVKFTAFMAVLWRTGIAFDFAFGEDTFFVLFVGEERVFVAVDLLVEVLASAFSVAVPTVAFGSVLDDAFAGAFFFVVAAAW